MICIQIVDFKLKAESSKPDVLNISFELSALSLELPLLNLQLLIVFNYFSI
jgi:hypothetical protein